jgi:hypothetical protein
MSHQHYFVCPRCGQQWFTLERDSACEHADCRAEIARLTAEIDRLRAALGSRGAHEELKPRPNAEHVRDLESYEIGYQDGESSREADCSVLREEIETLQAALRGVGTPPEKDPT